MPNLSKLLRLASSENVPFDNLNDFSRALRQQLIDHRYLKSFILLGIGVFIVIAAIVLFHAYKPKPVNCKKMV